MDGQKARVSLHSRLLKTLGMQSLSSTAMIGKAASSKSAKTDSLDHQAAAATAEAVSEAACVGVSLAGVVTVGEAALEVVMVGEEVMAGVTEGHLAVATMILLLLLPVARQQTHSPTLLPLEESPVSSYTFETYADHVHSPHFRWSR